jgi:hypothetical protein
MAKKCKDCDPNKYIEGLAYRGENGVSFDNFNNYNDIGQPYDANNEPTTDMLANVDDMLDAYNPIFSPGSLRSWPVSQNNAIKINGIDNSRGFWFVWSLTDGLIMYGSPGVGITPASITAAYQNFINKTVSNATVLSAIKNEPFITQFQTDTLPSYFTFNGFSSIAETNSNDPIRFSDVYDVSYSQNGNEVSVTYSNHGLIVGDRIYVIFSSGSNLGLKTYGTVNYVSGDLFRFTYATRSVTTSGFAQLYTYNITKNKNFIKNKINIVGYDTGYITTHVRGSKVVNVGTRNKPVYETETFKSTRSITIKCQSSDIQDPMYVTSAPTISLFKGQSISYTITTNLISSSQFSVYVPPKTKDLLQYLNLSFNHQTKTISGTVSNSIKDQIEIQNLLFTIRGPDFDSGNQKEFNLSAIVGKQATTGPLPTISAFTYGGSVGDKFSNSIRGLNGKQRIIAISSLPDGLSYNATKNVISGTVKHAGIFYAYASASNDRGTTSKVTLTFNFTDYIERNPNEGASFPSTINLPQGNFDIIKNNKFIIKSLISSRTSIFSPNLGDFIKYKKINKNEFDKIRKDGYPDGIQLEGLQINYDSTNANFLTFIPGNSKDAETCLWISVENIRNPAREFRNIIGTIDINGTYDVDFASAGLVDGIGNACYPPDSTNGPVSKPYSQNIDVTSGGNTKTGISADPAQNVPIISMSPSTVEHQVVFDSGPSFDTTSEFANQRLPKSKLLAYPNGIPNANGTYTYYVRFTDSCAFNYIFTRFTMYIGVTLAPRAGDVYSCVFKGTCFAKGTKVKTPKGDIEIEKIKVDDEVLAFDENEDIHISKVIDFIDHNKEPQPIYQIELEDGTIIKSTLSHQFLVNGEFKFLNDIEVGENLTSFDKKKLQIKSKKYIGMDVVYNLEVDKYHTYIAENIFVHNGRGPGIKIGTVECSRKGGCRIYTSRGWQTKRAYNYSENVTLTSSSIPANCTTLVSQAAATSTIINYGYQYRNSLLESKDIGITSLTNISILDVLGEGPIEGIVDYEIIPNPGFQKGDIGYKNGVTIKRYPGNSSLIRSVYWNEIPLADNTYPNNGSLNFEFIRLKFDNGDSAPRHTNIDELKNISLEEEYYSRQIQNGIYVNYLKARDENGTVIAEQIKLPKRLTSTKTVGSKLFGKRKFQDGSEKTYKKSITILTKDLYGLKLHIKALSLFKQIVDLTIWDTSDQAAENSVGGRIDRQSMTFKLYLKRVDRGVDSGGLVITPIKPDLNLPEEYSTLIMTGKLNAGPYIETFEWTGLDKETNDNTIGWEIEIEPTYTESVDANILLKSAIDSITEIYNDFLVLPHTAGVMTTFDARFFQSIPQRAYDTRLLKVKVPTNYNPFSKTYDPPIWDGTFKLAWTDNPAWCFYDIITNKRYGLGKYIDPQFTDKWTLYEISKYCDELVSDGRGGLEPRFTCNVLISTREDAYKVMNDMASVFRAIVYYSAGLIMTSQDRPKESIYLFNNSNVKDGEFTYSNTSKRVRRNVALVRYNDKENFYKPAVKYVENRDGLIKFGIREIEVSAFGCTSEGQAERLGKWTLLSENFESELVNFETSLPALYLKPGDIILVQDQNRQNKVLGGRTFSLDKNSAILDVKYEDISGFLPAIQGCKFNILTPAGNIEIGTEAGNEAMTYTGNNIIPYKDGNINAISSGISTSLIRRKQVQTIEYNNTTLENGTQSIFADAISLETGTNFNGFTRINFGTSELDNVEHTLLQNTVWTIEVDPNFYDFSKSPSVSGFSNTGLYPGAYLEPYLDKTQKFRILDIEEQEENRYKVTALQYDETKYALGDDI